MGRSPSQIMPVAKKLRIIASLCDLPSANPRAVGQWAARRVSCRAYLGDNRSHVEPLRAWLAVLLAAGSLPVLPCGRGPPAGTRRPPARPQSAGVRPPRRHPSGIPQKTEAQLEAVKSEIERVAQPGQQ